MKKLVVGALLLAGAAFAKSTLEGSIPVNGRQKADYWTLAKITMQDAVATGAKEGTVVEASLDREDGFLVYELEVRTADNRRKELVIDAGNGKVLLTKDKP